MKTLLFIFVLIGLSGISQINEGHVNYLITTTTNNPDMQMAIGMMKDSKMDIYFSDKATRSDFKMGLMMNVSTISNFDTQEVLSLMDGMGSKSATKNTLSEMTTNSSDLTVTYTEETKTILDFKCKKAVVKDETGTESFIWFTEDLKIKVDGQNYFNTQVKGFPLEFEINNNGLTMKFIAANFENKLTDKDQLFDMTVPEGYELKTPEELMKIGQ